MDPVEKRLAAAYGRDREAVARIPDGDPRLARAIAKMQQSQAALRRYQTRTSHQGK
jgi:hypothetical protein